MHALSQNGWHCRLCGQPLGTESSARLENEVILSVVIPVHNEGDQIAENLSLIHAETSKIGLPMVTRGKPWKKWLIKYRT